VRVGRALAVVTVLGALVTLGLPAVPASAEDVQALEWHLTALDVAAAQKISTGQGVIVAVLDSGVQADHPDLAGQVLPGTDLSTDNAYKGQIDTKNHGTGVAGVIAAKGGKGHMLGIAPGAKILPVLTADEPGQIVAQGIRWAVDHGAKVINISGGIQDPTEEEVAGVRYALDHDVVVVAAAGNTTQGDTHVIAPASIPGVIAVVGTDRTGNAWSGNVHGPEVTLAAPAADIVTLANHLSDLRPGGYVNVSGTSESAPMVAAAAALVRAKYPQLHVNDVINRLVSTADDLGAPGRDPVYGYGRLNIVKALTADVAPVSSNPLVTASPSAPAPRAAAGSDRTLLLAALAGGGLLFVVIVVVVVVAVARSRR
jgi:membrane-anchored mycosin MYCP